MPRAAVKQQRLPIQTGEDEVGPLGPVPRSIQCTIRLRERKSTWRYWKTSSVTSVAGHTHKKTFTPGMSGVGLLFDGICL